MFLIEWHTKNLPPYAPEPEEIEAGFDEFQKKFGAYATIDQVSRKINISEEALYKDWTAQEFWFKHLYLAWESYYQGKYRKVLMNKK